MNPPVSPLDALRDATALLQAGQPGRASELLGSLIRMQPGNAEAHRLLASISLQTGEFIRAQQELRTCLRLRPDDPALQLMLASALWATGQIPEAVHWLQDVLRRDPANLAAGCALARILLAQSRAQDAVCVLQSFSRHPRATSEFLMLYGQALMLLDRGDDAVEVFRKWLQQEPGNPEARLCLAGALVENGESVEAESWARGVTKNMTVHSPDAGFILARALMGQGRFEEAEARLRDVVHAKPDHDTAQNSLAGLVWMRTGDVAAACVEIDAALRAQPRLSVLRIVKARLLLSAADAPKALAEIEAGLALSASDSGLLKMAATVALNFDTPRALDYARRAVQAAPGNRAARVVFGNASLAVGCAREALQVADSLHHENPHDGQALALRADALRMLGDSRYRELLDYQHFVRVEPIGVPQGWTDLHAYLAELAFDLERLHTLQAHPIGNSLREGSQIPLVPQRSAFASIQAFPLAIDGPIRRYMQALGSGPDPMRRRNTGKYRLSGIWSVRLRPHGFHVNHYHPEGWISSACYLHLPPAVARPGGEGWLKFGEPAFPTRPALGPGYFLRPEPGLLALFPSYMWHGTEPFAGAPEDSRLTIAFDVVPTDS